MISEIYACGHNGRSAFVIVENGAVVHHGSYKWNGFIDFEGVSMPVNDRDCEVLAVICALMMCQHNNRKLVNIYTGRYNTQEIYDQRKSDSPYMESFARHAFGIDVYADKWQDQFYEKGCWVDNPFKNMCESLVENK